MRDDSKIHHIMADAMFRPRKQFCQFSRHRRHMLPEMDPKSDQPFHHKARMHLRHMLNHHTSSNNHSHVDNGKPRKNVSFGRVTEVTKDEIETDMASVCAESDSESSRDLNSEAEEDDAIFFTAATEDDLEGQLDDVFIEPTAVEVSLPWKRNTGRTPIPSSNKHTLPDDSHPLTGEAPSWVENASYTTASAVPLPHTVAGDELPEDVPHELPLPWKHTDESVCIDMEDGAQLAHVPLAVQETQVVTPSDTRCTAEEILPPPWPSSTSPPSVPSPSHSAVVEEVSHIPPPPWRQSSVCSPSMSYDLEIYSMKPQASCQSFLMSEAESKHSEHLPSHHIIECTKARHAGDIEMDDLLPSKDPSMSDTMDRVTSWVLKLNEGEHLSPWNGETEDPVTDEHNNVDEASSVCDDATTKL
ncbi:hypothetical protein CAPTEDRAFT_190001 [Capitella teleta]|uniref:Uncharacterized protein n=1 Tax=Capitella teleta TaxID=283909 RepID=R7T3Q2_CAPTE|nr:hypothetical protein CAPTEDRAFT_190001 [Capitella teleta]|eukprot:ELT87432.1 hypothetical protein CAPTEDRAFT_190001 [Capitella teleta]